MINKFIKGPVFAVIGDHDTNPEAIDVAHNEPDGLGDQMSWNYDHLAGLWKNNNFLRDSAVQKARTHYGGYSVLNQYGLRIITLNTDFWVSRATHVSGVY